MADARGPFQGLDVRGGEDLVDEAHPAAGLDLPVLVDDDPRALLAAVLEDPKAVVQVPRDGLMAGDAENPALLPRPEILVGLHT